MLSVKVRQDLGEIVGCTEIRAGFRGSGGLKVRTQHEKATGKNTKPEKEL